MSLSTNVGQGQLQVGVNCWPSTYSLRYLGFRGLRLPILHYINFGTPSEVRVRLEVQNRRTQIRSVNMDWQSAGVTNAHFLWGWALTYEQQKNKGGTETGQGGSVDTEEVLSIHTRYRAKSPHVGKASQNEQ